jgi:hypothetical protein
VAPLMHRAGRILIWLGLALTALGLTGGFALLFLDSDSAAVNLLGLVPLGFVTLFAGVVATLFGAPRP